MGCCGQAVGQPSKNTMLGTQSSQEIKFSNDSIVVNDGPNQIAKIDLCALTFEYEQFIRTAIKLPPNASNIPLQYSGLLGNNITFLLITATYESGSVVATPYGRVYNDHADDYVNYFFKNEPDVVRHFADMMILTGTENAPVQEVLVNNPNVNYAVRLDIMAATTSTEIQDSTTSINENLSIKDLTWKDILSDPISNDFIVYSNGTPVAYIDRDKIAGIEVNGKILSIDDTAIGQIDLTFIDDFNANQANSILTWAMASTTNNITSGMQADTVAPIITYTQEFTTDIILDNEGTSSTTGYDGVITKDDLYALWIESVIDDRDGNMLLDDNNMTIIEIESGNEVNAITRHGKYDTTIQVNDIAQNVAKDTFIINVKDTKAARQIVDMWVYNYVKGITVQPDIYLQDYTGNAINKQDLIDLVIAQIVDERDGEISKNINNVDVTILHSNIAMEHIDAPGTYYIQFTVKDSDKNASSNLWENISIILTDQLNVEVDHLILEIKTNTAPTVIWKDGSSYEIGLYEFSVNGIISKNQLYSHLVIDVEDDRTSTSDIFLINSSIIKTHEYDIDDEVYVPISNEELFYIDAKGIYTYQVQHIDSDAYISTDQKTVKII